jgi:uncharacterized protein YjbI with pentapeptide repeats
MILIPRCFFSSFFVSYTGVSKNLSSAVEERDYFVLQALRPRIRSPRRLNRRSRLRCSSLPDLSGCNLSGTSVSSSSLSSGSNLSGASSSVYSTSLVDSCSNILSSTNLRGNSIGRVDIFVAHHGLRNSQICF